MSQPTREVVRVGNDERILLAGLPGTLAAPLAEAFRQCDEPGRPAVLQVSLPHPLLGLDVDTGRFGPERPAPGHESGVLRRPMQDAAWRLHGETVWDVPEAYRPKGIALLYYDPTRPLPGADELLETP
ncbi:hypothetical protein FNV65_06690 [Streptomyces sp. S1A1-8]|uniref:hypothetical protein n=1 Tax=unclassified Streptomyces TaxID=2593676 RepID=UPI001161FF46|nr:MULTISPECIES: hypothetical protein [unclassified Streptomyces]QDN96020.1 hypothetical protein FNV58_08115 [Streptomyces sp. RLB1-9]QDO17741.1 hypothetical protein FNV65_06690 [Streptomyces sp. S1A1-8]QDO27869.1 hypothetical protein FNV63_06700 [Streptomyces sp. S1A1-3]